MLAVVKSKTEKIKIFFIVKIGFVLKSNIYWLLPGLVLFFIVDSLKSGIGSNIILRGICFFFSFIEINSNKSLIDSFPIKTVCWSTVDKAGEICSEKS